MKHDDGAKPCPFCKGQAQLNVTSGSWGYYPAKAEVRCMVCGAHGPATNDENNPEYKEDAVMLWNQRA